MQIFVETPRLILREMLPSDDIGLLELDSDPEVHRYLGNKPIRDIAEARQVIDYIRQQYLENGIGRWAVIEKETNAFVGWAGFKFVREVTNNHVNYYDLGYRLIKRFWGSGYATEAAEASLRYGFEQLKLREVYGMVDVDNAASRKVLEKLGFQFIERFTFDGRPYDWYKISKG